MIGANRIVVMTALAAFTACTSDDGEELPAVDSGFEVADANDGLTEDSGFGEDDGGVDNDTGLATDAGFNPDAQPDTGFSTDSGFADAESDGGVFDDAMVDAGFFADAMTDAGFFADAAVDAGFFADAAVDAGLDASVACTISGVYQSNFLAVPVWFLFNANGTWVVADTQMNLTAAPLGQGTYTFMNGQFTIQETPPLFLCLANEIGTYTVAFNANCTSFTLTLVTDACIPRAVNLNGSSAMR